MDNELPRLVIMEYLLTATLLLFIIGPQVEIFA